MMTIKILSFVTMSMIAQICTAQDIGIEDKEFVSLTGMVKILRNPTEENYNKAKQFLSAEKNGH